MKTHRSPAPLVAGLMVAPLIALALGIFVQVRVTVPDGRVEAPPPQAAGTPPVAAAGPQGTNPTLATGSAPPPAAPEPAAPEPVRRATDFAAAQPEWQKLMASGSAEQGQRISDAGIPGLVACASCHGKGGVVQTEALFPDLAGKQPEYIAKQLTDFRSGTRVNQVMTPIAKAMKDEDIASVAHYFGGLERPARKAPDQTAQRGGILDAWGDGALGVPSCTNCHGVAARGEGQLIPPLAGQPHQYFIGQMNAFRDGTRRNDDLGVMRAIAKRLSDADIQALADYYASMK